MFQEKIFDKTKAKVAATHNDSDALHLVVMYVTAVKVSHLIPLGQPEGGSGQSVPDFVPLAI